MKKTFKFDSEWSIAISLLPEEQQQPLTEAIKEYQSCDKMPDDLDPASMMGFLMAKAVIDRRKHANKRARERRALRRAQTAPLPVQTDPAEKAVSATDIQAENAMPQTPRHEPVAVTRFFQEGTPSTLLHDTVRGITQDNVFILRLCNVTGMTRNQATEAIFKLVNRRIQRRRPVNDLNRLKTICLDTIPKSYRHGNADQRQNPTEVPDTAGQKVSVGL